jgi:PAS domain S-box-containing protein
MATLAERIVQGAGDAILAADREGRIVLWNAAAERLFGFSAAEAIGQSLDLIVPERHRPRHWEGYRRVAETAETRYGTRLLRVPALRKDGSQVSIAFTIALLTDAAGRVEAMAAIIRDETARWQEEKALRARVKELEGGAGATRGSPPPPA